MSSSEDPAAAAPVVNVSDPAPGVTLVSLGGEHDLASEGEVSDAIAAALERGSDVIVDLGETLFIDSKIIGALIKGASLAGEEGRQLVLCLQDDSAARRALEITTVDQHLPHYETVEAAVDAIVAARD